MAAFALLLTTLRPSPIVARRVLSISTSARLGLKESASQDPLSNHDRHKRDSLEKQKLGRGHWKPELASDSEEAVKADHSPAETAAAMQERTKAHAEEKSKAGTSTRDGM